MNPSQEQRIDIEGGDLFVSISGEGPPLVLIHGMATDHRLWTPQVKEFAAHYQVISYDMRGFGSSSQPTAPYRAEDDLRCLLEKLEIPSTHLLGLSLGSSVATRFALAYPEMTQSLIVAGPVLQGFEDADDFMRALKAVWAIAREQGVKAARATWLQLPLFTTLLTSPDWAELARTMINDYDGWHWQNRDPEIWPEIMPAQKLGEITAPTLVITGDQEMAGLKRAGAFMLQEIANATGINLADAGHVVNLEQPPQFNRAVIDFLGN